jgi:hypothetical protein
MIRFPNSVAVIRFPFDHPITGHTPVQFPVELIEVFNLSNWIRNAIRTYIANGGTIKNKDVMHLLMKPKSIALRYTKMKAYGNHYRVNEGDAETTMATYDFRVASIFQQPQATHQGTTLGSIQYVGVLKNIILLNYGPISLPMVFFKYDWVTHGSDRWGNPTYKQDEDGFLLANFRHLKVNIDEPYVFPTKVQ